MSYHGFGRITIVKQVAATLCACLLAAPAFAATFTYTGPYFTPSTVGSSGFKRVVLQFTVPGTVQPNTTYTMSKLAAYADGLNKLPQITSYLAKGATYGGQLDSFLWGTVTTGPTGLAISWTFKIQAAFVDGLGNEGYDLLVNGPGNAATCPYSECGYDSLLTTLPETLPTTVTLTSTHFGVLKHN